MISIDKGSFGLRSCMVSLLIRGVIEVMDDLYCIYI